MRPSPSPLDFEIIHKIKLNSISIHANTAIVKNN